MDITDLVYYDQTSPSGLRWKVEIRGGKYKNVVLTYPGMIAGTKVHRQNGNPMWWQVRLCGKQHRVHRIIWYLKYGKFPTLIDHIDRNPFNNNIENLREVDNKLNSRNCNNSKNTREKLGVYLETYNGCTYWTANVVVEGKNKRKRFNIKKLGIIESQVLASCWREEMIKKLNIEGYGYAKHYTSC